MDPTYFKLLEYEKYLESEGKVFFKENKEEYIKLLRYEGSILDHFKWEQKDQYVLLLNNFLRKKIYVDQYADQLFALEDEIENQVKDLKRDVEKLKQFKPNPVSKNFSSLLDEFFSDLREFNTDPDPELRCNSDISEIELVDGVKRISLQIQQYP